MAKLESQTFELNTSKTQKFSIELERVDNEHMIIRTWKDDKPFQELAFTIQEYSQLVKLLNDSKFIYSKENTL